MPFPYPPEFRQRAIALAREGRQAKQTAHDRGIHEVTIHSWLRQDDIDHGRRPGKSTHESSELRAANARIRQLEQEIEILRRASTWLEQEERVDPKGRTWVSTGSSTPGYQ
jgi:transposase